MLLDHEAPCASCSGRSFRRRRRGAPGAPCPAARHDELLEAMRVLPLISVEFGFPWPPARAQRGGAASRKGRLQGGRRPARGALERTFARRDWNGPVGVAIRLRGGPFVRG
eukprot:4900725-Pyramimonas_sp.AAC.1